MNKNVFSAGFMRRLNTLFILLFLHLILLNSINFFTYISIVNSSSLKESSKSLIEAFAEGFVKTPETEKDNSKDINESDEALVYMVNDYSFMDFTLTNNKNRGFLLTFYGTPFTDITTPPPKGNS